MTTSRAIENYGGNECAAFRALAKSVHSYDSEARIVIALQCFLDESGDEQETTMAIGGFIARADVWESLIPKWKERISMPNVPYPIKAFHMTDCSTGGGEFQDKYGWNHDMRHNLIKDLIGIIALHKVALFGCGVDFKAYKTLPTVNGDTALGRGEYYVAFQQAIELACNNKMVEGLPKEESVAFFFDRNTKYEFWANEFHKSMKNDLRLSSWRERVGSLTFEDKEKLIPLQVGDLGAFEVMKESARLLGHHAREKRKSLIAIQEAKRAWKIIYYDKRSLEIVLRLKQEELGIIPKTDEWLDKL